MLFHSRHNDRGPTAGSLTKPSISLLSQTDSVSCGPRAFSLMTHIILQQSLAAGIQMHNMYYDEN
jgi:hypothetical protein